ncbi:MAG TPA: hypothetical protein VLQ48_12365 [Chloroflexia bacterium]|nr:hypothetical protein [Chloroflexia bacterium]
MPPDKIRNRAFIENVEVLSPTAWPRYALRPYQSQVARAIAQSVMKHAGEQFVVVFARQSGKDELLAQLSAYLMWRAQLRGGSIITVTPTYRPQGLIARRRLYDRLSAPPLFSKPRTMGNTLSLGKATCGFLSAHPHAQARGETASLMLVCNEAQDVLPARWDAVFDPMGAASHATQVFSGTVWTSKTLLARQMAYLGELERKDGKRRVFKVGWEEVAQYVPEYGEQVRARIAQFGRDHPFIRTEYFLEEIDDAGRLFGPARRAQMRGDHPRARSATPGMYYALLLDVAGADEKGTEPPSGASGRTDRDATALTVVEVDLAGLDDPLVMRPRYRVVDRRLWVGTSHPQLYAALADLARNVWGARWLVVDATGVGAGLAGFLGQALPGKVVPFVFSAQSKSQLGWDFLSVVESGRYKEYFEDGESDTGLFWTQVEACASQVSDAPGKLLRWSVEDARTHDDLLISASLCAVLDRLDWRPRVARGR